MILAPNTDAALYRGIHPNLDLALEKITPEFFASLGSERVELRGKEVYCTKFSYETIPDGESFFEAHEKYLDIHIMLSGSERVEIEMPEKLTPLRSEPENDFWAYTGAGRSLVISPGEFLLVFPNDAHRIKMRVNGPETVSKAVFKVRIF